MVGGIIPERWAASPGIGGVKTTVAPRQTDNLTKVLDVPSQVLQRELQQLQHPL
jgi:hypothetical protein